MALSKRIRYEVLKRDNHTCRYCHATDSPLTVDHVTPTALGGSDDPGNLVAACKDCNAGKSSTSPDAAVVAQVSDEALRWGAAIRAAADAMVANFESDKDRLDWFLLAWRSWDEDLDYLPNGWVKSIDCWIAAGLPRTMLLNCLDLALANRSVQHRSVFAYMGGIARSRIADLQEAAKAILEASDQ